MNYSFSIQILFLLQKDYMAQPLQTVLFLNTSHIFLIQPHYNPKIADSTMNKKAKCSDKIESFLPYLVN